MIYSHEHELEEHKNYKKKLDLKILIANDEAFQREMCSLIFQSKFNIIP